VRETRADCITDILCAFLQQWTEKEGTEDYLPFPNGKIRIILRCERMRANTTRYSADKNRYYIRSKPWGREEWSFVVRGLFLFILVRVYHNWIERKVGEKGMHTCSTPPSWMYAWASSYLFDERKKSFFEFEGRLGQPFKKPCEKAIQGRLKNRHSPLLFNSKLKKEERKAICPFPKEKIAIILRCGRAKRTLPDIKLIRTDTTFDLSQRPRRMKIFLMQLDGYL